MARVENIRVLLCGNPHSGKSTLGSNLQRMAGSNTPLQLGEGRMDKKGTCYLTSLDIEHPSGATMTLMDTAGRLYSKTVDEKDMAETLKLFKKLLKGVEPGVNLADDSWREVNTSPAHRADSAILVLSAVDLERVDVHVEQPPWYRFWASQVTEEKVVGTLDEIAGAERVYCEFERLNHNGRCPVVVCTHVKESKLGKEKLRALLQQIFHSPRVFLVDLVRAEDNTSLARWNSKVTDDTREQLDLLVRTLFHDQMVYRPRCDE